MTGSGAERLLQSGEDFAEEADTADTGDKQFSSVAALGSALMQPTLEKADSAGMPTYIEASTERSASLYERLGFRHMGSFELPDGGPPVWPMLRPAPDVGSDD